MSKKKGKIRYIILGLLFFATTINYIDRQVIGILKPYIADDLGWNEMDYGLIVTAFQVAYAIGLLFSGALLDKYGTRIGYTIAIAVWSLAGMLHAAVRSAIGFSIVRFFLGLGESANFPAAIKSVAEWFPQRERAHATGWFNSGSTVGAIVAPLFVTGITIAWGWQWAFIITGSLGFIWIFLWLIFFYPPRNHPRLSKDEFEYIHQDAGIIDSKEEIKWIALLKYRQTYALCATRFISDWVWWFFLFWAPDFLHKTHGIDIKESILPLILIYTVAGFGGILGGWISSSMINNGIDVDIARKRAILICALSVLPIMLVPWLGSLWGSVILISIACAGHMGWASNMFAIISDIFPKRTVGSVTGLTGFTGAVGGALSASFVGLVLDTTGSYFLIFIIASIVYLINWIIIKAFLPKIKLLPSNQL
jgi:ACS family hexuronate transporter-like MFS transporter